MPQPAFPKTRLLRVLRAGETIAMPELTARLPEFSWQELFLTIKVLNQQGAIQLHRRGYDFFVSLMPVPTHVSAAAACAHLR